MAQESSFAVLLGEGLDEALRQRGSLPGLSGEPALIGTPVRELVERVQDGARQQAEEDRILAAVIGRHRCQRASGWSAVLLDMLSPVLAELIELNGPIPPAVEPGDLGAASSGGGPGRRRHSASDRSPAMGAEAARDRHPHEAEPMAG
jgi:hypothetical protein